MLQKLFSHSLTVIIPSIILLSHYPSTCKKCELKGMVDNRIQCVLHDRAEVLNRKSVNETDSVHWLQHIMKDLDAEIEAQIEKCGKALDCNKHFFMGSIEDFEKHVILHIPGTRWCSGEDLTKSENVHTLECCQEHKNCKSIIKPNETKFEITNHAIFARSHCDCDKKFYYCLKGVNDIVSKEVGYTYFSVLKPQCFKSDFPITGCVQYMLGKCNEYKFDVNKPKKYQWFDNPLY